MKIVISLVAAVVLGIAVMIAPIMTYTQFFATTDVIPEFKAEPNNSASFGGERSQCLNVTSLETLDEAARVCGAIDAGPTPFPSSLYHAASVVGIGLFAALGVSLYSRKKAKLF